MSLVDLRDPTKIYKNGSSMLDLGMTEEQAQEAFGDEDAVAAWYRVARLAGGTIGRDTDAQRVRDEGTVVVATTSTTNDWTIDNTIQMTDARTLKLMEYWETHELPARYFLPTEDPTKTQLHYHPAMTKDEGADRISTSAGVRTMGFVARGEKARHVYDDLPVVQTSWPAAFNGAKTSAFGT